MFVLDELERLLQSQASADQQANRQQGGPTNSPDIERIDVNQLELFKTVRLHEIDINKELNEHHHEAVNLKAYISSRHYLTVDILFASAMKTLLLDRLAQIPERSFPSARLMICDQEAYGHLLKFQHVLQEIYPNDDSHRFLLHKRPYNVTAVVPISEILDLLERVNRPIAKIRHETSASFDYTIIKQVFPYLRITDLVIVLGEIGPLKLQTFTLNGTKSQQAIQFLTHFARSSHLIELLPIRGKLGHQHFIYDNVSSFMVPKYSEQLLAESDLITFRASSQQQTIQRANPHLKLTLMQLGFIAHRLHQLVGQLEWQLDSITFRLGDPFGFSKIFSQILESIVKSEQPKSRSMSLRSSSERNSKPSTNANLSLVPVRVIVLDRFFDLQGLLRHSDRYGPFLEQEIRRSNIDGSLVALRLDRTDPLDGVMQFVKLTDALKTILEYSTTNPKADSQKRRERTRLGAEPTIQHQHATTGTNSIHRHLDLIKSIYKSMNEGYLLLLKLEASLSSVMAVLQTLREPLDEAKQNDLSQRIKRISIVLLQLIAVQSNLITPMNAWRVAALLIDTINIFQYLHPIDTSATETLLDVKDSLITLKEFKSLDLDLLNSYGISSQTASPLESTASVEHQQRDGRKDKTIANKGKKMNLHEKLKEFELISRQRCSHRATASLEEIVEQFYERRLDPKSFPTVRLPPMANGLVKNVSRNKIIVLVLGSISYDELARIKFLESALMRRRKASHHKNVSGLDNISGDIIMVSSGVIRPDQFAASL